MAKALGENRAEEAMRISMMPWLTFVATTWLFLCCALAILAAFRCPKRRCPGRRARLLLTQTH